jgi:hypothetical protein
MSLLSIRSEHFGGAQHFEDAIQENLLTVVMSLHS